MRDTDLMIGDWVYKKSGVLEENKPFKIDEIIHEDLYGYEVFDCYGHARLVEDIYPIPITEDILKANGFKLRKEINDYIREYYLPSALCKGVAWCHIEVCSLFNDGLCVDLQVSDGSIFRSNYSFKYCVVKCNVHELQHAFRLFGMNDFADNFKIE